jgi:hypothetical protein
MRTVSLDQVGREELPLPPRVQEALGELVGSAKEGLLALSVGVGLGVLAEWLEEEVVEVVGLKGGHDPDRAARPLVLIEDTVLVFEARAVVLVYVPDVAVSDLVEEMKLFTLRCVFEYRLVSVREGHVALPPSPKYRTVPSSRNSSR